MNIDPRPFDIPVPLRAWLTSEQLADPDVAEFVHCDRRAAAEEKESSPDDWTSAERAAWESGDWPTFSRSRGYTEDEIANFARFVELAEALQRRYGEDFPVSVSFELSQLQSEDCRRDSPPSWAT